MGIEIRPIVTSDYEKWLPLWKGYLHFYQNKYYQEQAELTFQRLSSKHFNLWGFVATKDHNAVGFVHCLFHPSTWTHTDYCYLQDLFVLDDMRGQGVGRKLIEKVVNFAKSHSSNRVYWLTQESNQQARVLYDKISKSTGYIHYRLDVP